MSISNCWKAALSADVMSTSDEFDRCYRMYVEADALGLIGREP